MVQVRPLEKGAGHCEPGEAFRERFGALWTRRGLWRKRWSFVDQVRRLEKGAGHCGPGEAFGFHLKHSAEPQAVFKQGTVDMAAMRTGPSGPEWEEDE